MLDVQLATRQALEAYRHTANRLHGEGSMLCSYVSDIAIDVESILVYEMPAFLVGFTPTGTQIVDPRRSDARALLKGCIGAYSAIEWYFWDGTEYTNQYGQTELEPTDAPMHTLAVLRQATGVYGG